MRRVGPYPGVEAEHLDRSATCPVSDLAPMPRSRKAPERQRGSSLCFVTSWFHPLRDDDSVARLQLDILVRIVTLEDFPVIEGQFRGFPVDQPHHVDFFHIGKGCKST